LFRKQRLAFAAPISRPIIQLRIVAEDPFLIEGQAPLGREIGGEPGARCDSVVQCDDPSMFAFLLGHRAWKGVTQAFDHLEEREIDVGSEVGSGVEWEVGSHLYF
jgi:hypothetical protein